MELLNQNSEVNQHINNNDIHVTLADKLRWNQIDDIVRLLDMLYKGKPITTEDNVNFTTETGETWTI